MYRAKQKEHKRSKELVAGSVSLQGLQGRQSVRATFQLPAGMIDLLGAVASQFGVKQKSLLDSLIEDSDALALLADRRKQQVLPGEEKKRKTFVVSKRTLQALEEVAAKSRLPRDQVLAISISRLFPVVAEEQVKHRRREALLNDLVDWVNEGERMYHNVEKRLGNDDPAIVKLNEMISACRHQLDGILHIVEKGRLVAGLEIDGEDGLQEMPGARGAEAGEG